MASRKESRIAHKVSDYLYDIEYDGESTVPNATVRSWKMRYSDFGKDLKRAEKKWDKKIYEMFESAPLVNEQETPKVEVKSLYTLTRTVTGSTAVYNQQQLDFWTECMSDAKDRIDEAKQELSDQNVVAIVSMIVGAVLYGFISLLIG